MKIKFLIKLVVLFWFTCSIATPRVEQIQELFFNTLSKYNIPLHTIRTLNSSSPTVQKRLLMHQLYTEIGTENLCNEIKLIGQSLCEEITVCRYSITSSNIRLRGNSLLKSAINTWNSLVRWDITSGPTYNRFLDVLACTISQAAALYSLSQQEVPAISDISAVANTLIEQSIITMNQKFIATLKKLLTNDIDLQQLQQLVFDAKNLCNEYNNMRYSITNLDAQQDYTLITNVAEIMNANLDDPCYCCDLLRTLLNRSCTSR